jgi:hypothetical protein
MNHWNVASVDFCSLVGHVGAMRGQSRLAKRVPVGLGTLLKCWAFGGLLMSLSCQPSEPVPESQRRDASRVAEMGDAGEVGPGTPVQDLGVLDARIDGGGSGDFPSADVVVESDMVSDLGHNGPWHSALYPENWQPEFTHPSGRFLHDFSYAGYRLGGDLPSVDPMAQIFDVDQEFGADPSGVLDSTQAFQRALDAAGAAGGGVVAIPEGTYWVGGTLEITASDIVVRGAGRERSFVHFTKSEGMTRRNHIQIRGDVRDHEEAILVADGENRSDSVLVDDASSFEVGDDVALGWVITDAFVAEHQMTDVWTAFNGMWQAVFLRTVVEVHTDVSPHRIVFDVPLRYVALVRDQASLRRQSGYLREVGIEALSLSNAVGWDAAWDEMQVHVLGFFGVKDAWVRDVATFVSPIAPEEGKGAGAHLQSGGLIVAESKRVTVADTHLGYSQNRGPGGCGYLFDVRRSSEILFRDASGIAGRHNFIQNWGFGTSGVVWLRVRSEDGRAYWNREDSFSVRGHSEFHHSLAMGNLIDSSWIEDGWSAVNRKRESSGAGHTATESVFWNNTGAGVLRSYQHGYGYVIKTGLDLEVLWDPPVSLQAPQELFDRFGPWEHTRPIDWVEGLADPFDVVPTSLYEDQRARRMARAGR